MGKFEELLKTDKVDLSITEKYSEPAKPATAAQNEPVSDGEKYGHNQDETGFRHLPLAKVFGIKPESLEQEQDKKLDFISKALDLKGDSIESKLMHVESKIGSAPEGVDRLNHVYGYVKLLVSTKKLLKQIKRYEGKAKEEIDVNENITSD